MEEFNIILSEKEKNIINNYPVKRTRAEKIFGRIFVQHVLPFLLKNPSYKLSHLRKHYPEALSIKLHNGIIAIINQLATLSLISVDNAKRSYKITITGDLEQIKELASNIQKLHSKVSKIVIEWDESLKVDKSNATKYPYWGSNKFESIFDKYWNNSCDKKLKELYELHGRRFWECDDILSSSTIENVFGKNKFNLILKELTKICEKDGKKEQPYFLVSYFRKRLSKLFPNQNFHLIKYLISKECVLCGNLFFPEDVHCYFTKKPIPDIIICDRCYSKALYKGAISKGSDELKLNCLKRLIDLIGFIPPSNFPSSTRFFGFIPPEHEVEIIRLLHRIHGPIFKKRFGSYFKALIAAGILTDKTRKTPRGYMCIATDGHECRSLGEKRIDDWLFKHSITHEKEPRYPGEYNFRGDWKVEEYFIEYWGLKGQEDYDNKTYLKREIAKEYNIKLVEITPDDLNNLDEKLKLLLKKGKKTVTHEEISIGEEIAQQANNGKEVIQLKKDDKVVQGDKHCIYVNGSSTINCKYYDVRHPDKETQKLIHEIARGES